MCVCVCVCVWFLCVCLSVWPSARAATCSCEEARLGRALRKGGRKEGRGVEVGWEWEWSGAELEGKGSRVRRMDGWMGRRMR